MFRRLTLAILGLPLLLAGGAWSRTADSPLTVTTFAITGHGWGHGVGMGQWGALGLAKNGATYDKILAHYYPGTEFGNASVTKIRVLVSETAGAVSVGSPAAFKIKDGSGAVHDLAPGRYTIGPGLAVALDASQPPQPLPGPLTLIRGASPLEVGNGHPYRGRIQLQAVGKKLQAVNIVGIDAYVRGVVTQEMPEDWPAEALRAQAVAARSFALAILQDRRVLYGDTRGQVYGGIAAETSASAAATDATKGKVLLYRGKVATTFFCSSSGGRTAPVTDSFPDARPVPYLVSVNDPTDAVSPFHDWGPIVLPAGKLAKILGVAGAADVETVPGRSHAREVVVTGAGGKEKSLPASTVRLALGLRSTWFTVGVLSLSRLAGTAAPGAAVTLTGLARRVAGPVTLELKQGNEDWSAGPKVTPGATGAFSLQVTPEATTLYRLSAKEITSGALRVPVSGDGNRKRVPAVSLAGSAPAARTTSAFLPNDPLAAQQWYLAADRAFDFWPEVAPQLQPVKVAVIDTGIDLEHPELAGRVVRHKSFVGGTVGDTIGHGTFVAGVIAAASENGQGIAGIAFPAQLIVAKVVGADGSIDPEVEARAIRWAVDRGARVVNLSLGGVRDPAHPKRDTYSVAEQAAIEYAYSHGAVVVAAVGNGDQAPSSPWPYASYPAALQHVIGVAALAQDGSIPGFSNRDPVFDDIAAPGEAMLSTFPRALTAARPTCVDQGYSDCGPSEYREAGGTSFAAPQVTAAAALLLAAHPELAPDQVAMLIERSAVDVDSSTGCRRCLVGRDALSGWGRLDITSALEAADSAPPPVDRHETNDDAGVLAPKLWGRSISVEATIDFWDDQIDVYRVKLQAGEKVSATLRGPEGTNTNLVLWKPGTEHVEGLSVAEQAQRATQSVGIGPDESVRYRARRSGWYFVEVKAVKPGSGAYRLEIAKNSSYRYA